MTIIPETITPKQLAEQTGWSEQLIRKLARARGACLGGARGMRLREADVEKILTGRNEIDFAALPKRSRRNDQVYLFAHYGTVKIGWSSNWRKRLTTLQTACAYRVDVLAVYRGGLDFEKSLHVKFAEYRIRDDGEWFRDCSAIRKYVEEHKKACLLR